MKKADVIALIWMLVLILFLRAFMVEPFKIPSSSMVPTLLVGDHLFVAKASYDIGIPFTNIKLFKVSDPKRGDVVVFQYPNPEKSDEKEGQYYIKRLIGLPGDKISVSGGVPTINGVVVPQTPVPDAKPGIIPGYPLPEINSRGSMNYSLLKETLPLMDHAHWIQRSATRTRDLPETIARLKSETGQSCIEVGKAILGEAFFLSANLLNEVCPFTVPEGHFFMMGDNRDESADSREWGFVDRSLLKGRALFIWLSLLQSDSVPGEGGPVFRWSRMGLNIN